MHDEARWLERWQTGETRWQKDGEHPFLVEQFDAAWGHVLVPLCGASLDLGWLAAQGTRVTGLELSAVAVDQVFERLARPTTKTEVGPFTRVTNGELTIFVGDAFDMRPEYMPGVADAVWDRAALVAINPDRRAEYADLMRRLAPNAALLLEVLEYDPSLMEGPPHSVPVSDLRALYGELQLLEESDLSEEFADRGHAGEFRRKAYRGTLSPRPRADA